MHGRLIITTIIIMALDRENRDNAYLTGRLIAVVEHYASKHFGPGTLSEAYNHPARLVEVFGRYIDRNDEYFREIDAVPPVSVYTADEKSRMMVGYYHQRAVYDDANTAERLRIGKRIAELRKERGLTQQDVADRAGLQRNHLSRIEQGKYSVGFDTLQSIANALGMQVDFIAPL